MGGDYKQEKEAFVSGMTGSSILHVNMISAVALTSIALYSALRTRLPPNRSLNFPIEWLILIIPLLLSMTLFANSPGFLSLLCLLPTGLLLLLPSRDSSSPPLPSNTPGSPNPMSPRSNFSTPNMAPKLQSHIQPLPALTTYRAHMMLMTILAILAVDFPVFPRNLVKCETFGVSLMDLGVGSFVFSQGIVSSIPLLKDPSYLDAPLIPKTLNVIRKILPVIILGLVRVLLVKGTEYPEHESEYGTHWNFFITLALLPVLQVVLHPLIHRVPVSMVGVSVALAHQMSLSFMGLESYVLFEPRTTIISANKEGIVSLTGYLAIHLLGLSMGTLILPPSPSWFRHRQRATATSNHRKRNSDQRQYSSADPATFTFGVHREHDKTATELISYSVVWWSLMGFTKLFGVGSAGGGAGISRRMVNLPYILWIAAFNSTFLLGYLLLDLYFFPSPFSKSLYDPNSKLKRKVAPGPTSSRSEYADPPNQPGSPPPLLEAINKNGLALFLLANVATGLINLTIPTMYVGNLWAMVVLSGYAFGVCLAAWTLRNRRLIQL